MATAIFLIPAAYLLLAPLDAAAAPSFSISVGLMASDVDHRLDGPFGLPEVSHVEHSTTNARFSAEYRHSRWLNFQAGGGSLGTDQGIVLDQVGCPGSCPEPPPPIERDVHHEANVYWLAWLPSYERNGWSVFGKLGAARVGIRARVPEVPLYNRDSNSTEILLGAGVAYYSAFGLGVRVEYDRFGGSADGASIALSYRF